MRPLLHPTMVNGRTGDPALYIETLFESRAILFDLGDITSLSARKIQRLERVFISHAHIDHFIGFDRLLRVLVGRDKKISLYGRRVLSITFTTNYRAIAGILSIVIRPNSYFS